MQCVFKITQNQEITLPNQKPAVLVHAARAPLEKNTLDLGFLSKPYLFLGPTTVWTEHKRTIFMIR